MSTAIQFVEKGKQGIIKFNRPAVRNALNLPMMRDFVQALTVAEQTSHLQLLVLEGEGGVFSAGGDIQMMLDTASPDDTAEAMELLSSIAKLLYRMPMITIAHIQGAAAGLGLSIALGCDYILAEANAKIAMNFIGIGLVPDGGGHFFLAERLGSHAAKQLIWEGRTMTAQDAKALGIIDHIAAEGESSRTLNAFIEKLSRAPLAAMIETKLIYHTLKQDKLEKSLLMEGTAQRKMRESLDHQEGIRAFLEKRQPIFQGE